MTIIHEQIERAAKALAKCMDYPWDHMPEKGRAEMRKHALTIIEASQPIADVQADGSYLNPGDLSDLKRLNEVFEDNEGWDIPKTRMQRLSEIGVIRHHVRDIYSITAFGRLCLGDDTSRLPLETPEEYNSRQAATVAHRQQQAAAKGGE